MNRCPITYEPIGDDVLYSRRGLTLLHRNLDELRPFLYTVEEQLRLAAEMATKLSIQGVQPKLSVQLDIRERSFAVVERGGRYILKPQNPIFPHLPENEDLTMKLAAAAGCETPVHGLARAKDGSLLYFIRRFDRRGKDQKIAMEDFAQLAGLSRDTKYAYSLEKVIALLEKYMTFPVIEKAKLFRLTLFNFLAGNEDAHLKNYSIILRDAKRELSPCYDLLNTTLALEGGAREESALPLAGKKRNFTKNDFSRYLGRERLSLPGKVVDSITEELKEALPVWQTILEASFLPQEKQEAYRRIVEERAERVFG